MPYFRVSAARANEKLDFLIRADDIGQATAEVHKGGYTILSIEEQVEGANTKKQIFYFDAIATQPNGTKSKKSGQIQSDDAMRAYQTLVEKYNCQIDRIYTDTGSSDEEKILVTARVAEAYRIFIAQKTNEHPSQDTKTSNVTSSGSQSQNLESELSPIVQKELALYRSLIDTVLFKIENITAKQGEYLSSEKKSTLQLLYSTLRQTKNITNIAKLKIVGETALKKIGELEVEIIRKKGGEQKDIFLKETNSLLKQFGSKASVSSGEGDIGKKAERIMRTSFRSLRDFYRLLSPSESSSKKAAGTPQSQSIAEGGEYSYYHQLQRLELYKEKLTLNKGLLKTTLDPQEKERVQAKIRLIEQNIALIHARIGGKEVSYTRIVKGMEYYQDLFCSVLHGFSRVMLATVLFVNIAFFYAQLAQEDALLTRIDLSLPLIVIFLLSGVLLRMVQGYLSGIAVLCLIPLGAVFIFINTSTGIG